jgi:hypothetical protein
MKRTFYFVLLVAVFITTFNSCKKEKDQVSFSREKLAGNWEGTLLATTGSGSPVRFHLNVSGINEIEATPFDGITDFFGDWNVQETKFTSKFQASGTILTLTGTVDNKGLKIEGTVEQKLNGEVLATGTFLIGKK